MWINIEYDAYDIDAIFEKDINNLDAIKNN